MGVFYKRGALGMSDDECMEFHRVTLEDRDRIVRCLEHNPYMNCDYSFGNLYNWGFYYKTEVSFHKGMMVVRFESEEGQRPAYLMPIPESSDLPEERVAEVLEDMELSMLSNGHPLTIMAVSAEGVDFLRKTYPELLHVLSSRDYSDYVYLRERLATLSGKKLQKRRNHVNRFRKQYPDYQYEEISDANVEECYQLEREWYDQSAQSSDITEERRMVETALREYKEIGLMGGAIRAEGKIIAFSLGMAINPDCFGVHIEKADPSIDGAFAIMTQEFAKHIPEQYTYVNREEDLGVEGLRRAKLALRPVKILDKHTVMMTYDPEGECR